MKLPHRRQFLHLAAGAAVLSAMSQIARAQTYPSRPITIIIGFAAGGPTDTAVRILAERMRVSLGQNVIIENVTGANGSIGVGRVARAAGDGYTTIAGGWDTHVMNGALYPLSYDVVQDFEPISLFRSTPYLILSSNAIPANDIEGLITWLKAHPNKASAGSNGAGSPQQVGGLLFQSLTGTRFPFVPYRGSGPAMQDLVAGQIDLMFESPVNALPHARAGRIKSYAVMAKSRLTAAPDIQTVDEAGLPGLYFSYWGGLWAPKSTPKNTIAKLNAAVVDALADPSVRSSLAALGLEIFPREQQTPEALAALQKTEIEKWWPIIKAANIKGE
jgi:tripartite-type tricarboxylate transporter receptor subunit TctC